jgi:hypothetical protein
MTPTEIRTALEMLRDEWRREANSNLGPMPAYAIAGADAECQTYHACADALDDFLSALPGETVPATIDHQERADRFRRLTTPVPLSDVEQLIPDPDYGFGDTGPAPPRALVEVVREWQEAEAKRRHFTAEGDDTLASVYRDTANTKRASVLAYPLPAPEAQETPR